MPTVTFVKEKKTIEVPEGTNLRKAARKNGVQLYWGPHQVANCRGMGTCGSCAVVIKKGAETGVSKTGWWEKFTAMVNPLWLFKRAGREDTCRLACQTKVQGDIEVETQPETNLHGEKFWG